MQQKIVRENQKKTAKCLHNIFLLYLCGVFEAKNCFILNL